MSSDLTSPTTVSDRALVNNRYELQRLLGTGTTGVVYLAEDLHLQRKVAVKILDAKMADRGDVCLRFDQEIRITARLDHPGVVAVFESAESHDGLPCYVMSLALGQPLDEFIAQLQKDEQHWSTVPLAERLTVFLKLLEVMAYAHDAGVVHRDLKPANIVLGQFGEVRVLDWGLARVIDDPSKTTSSFDGLSTAFERNQVKEVDATLVGESVTATIIKNGDDATGGHDLVPDDDMDRDTVALTGKHPSVPTVAEKVDEADEYDTAQTNRHETSSVFRKAQNVASGRWRASSSVASGNGSERSTRLGAVLGSPIYMSPEQARGEASKADRRSDIYGLGVILVELMTLHTPHERRKGELLTAFLQRIRDGKGRRSLVELWPDAPQALQRICHQALAYDPEDRYQECSEFMDDVRKLLDQISASFSELERQRLEREREGEWLPVGNWIQGRSEDDCAPFQEKVIPYLSEPIGQVPHPEWNGLLMGGSGLQMYPIVARISDDVRVVFDLSMSAQAEVWILLRGAPPHDCYIIRIGDYGGRWITIGLSRGAEVFRSELLTLRAVEHDLPFAPDEPLRRRIECEVIGSHISVRVDQDEPLVIQDPCPLIGPLHQQMAIATMDSQVLVHRVQIEQRRSPLMVPAHAVANELLRQDLFPQAISYYRRFLEEHAESEDAAEARFMLCQAYRRAGFREQAEQELHEFLVSSIDHPLAQDAMVELAQIRTDLGSQDIAAGVRTVLSYQDAGDRVRARFCLWAVNIIHDHVREEGLSEDVQASLHLLRHLVTGFGDEELLHESMATVIYRAAREYGRRLLDSQAYDAFADFQRQVSNLQALGYEYALHGLHLPGEYVDVSRRLQSLNVDDGIDGALLEGICKEFHSERDFICLAALGCSQQLVSYLKRKAGDGEPTDALIYAIILLRLGEEEQAREQLGACFNLMDTVESERTNIAATAVSRLAMYALGFLPWKVVWEPLVQNTRFPAYQALAAWLAETLEHKDEAEEAYRHIYNTLGTGFRAVAEQGLARLGLDT